MKNYDVMVILPIGLNEEECDGVLGRLRDEVTRLGGGLDDVRRVGKRTFARPMKKQDVGHYYAMSLSLDPAAVGTLRGRIRLIENLFRIQIVNHVPKPAPVAPRPAGGEPGEPDGESQ